MFRQPEELVGRCNKREVPGQGQLYNLAVRELHGPGRQQVSQRHQHAGHYFEHNRLFQAGFRIRIQVFWSDLVSKIRSDLDPVFKILSDPGKI